MCMGNTGGCRKYCHLAATVVGSVGGWSAAFFLYEDADSKCSVIIEASSHPWASYVWAIAAATLTTIACLTHLTYRTVLRKASPAYVEKTSPLEIFGVLGFIFGGLGCIGYAVVAIVNQEALPKDHAIYHSNILSAFLCFLTSAWGMYLYCLARFYRRQCKVYQLIP